MIYTVKDIKKPSRFFDAQTYFPIVTAPESAPWTFCFQRITAHPVHPTAGVCEKESSLHSLVPSPVSAIALLALNEGFRPGRRPRVTSRGSAHRDAGGGRAARAM